MTSKSAYEGSVDLSIDLRAITGGLMYASVASRPDIAYAVGFLSRYLDKPTKHLWSVALKILRYLSGTKNLGPEYTGNAFNNVEAFSDADWAGCHATRRSTSGMIVLFGGNPIMWRSQRQNNVTLSSQESEIVACSETGKFSVWFARLLGEIGYSVVPILRVDNTACIQLLTECQVTKRSRHIETRFLWTREKFEDGELKIKHCPSDSNIADLGTKPVPEPQFTHLRNLSGLTENVPSTRDHRRVGGNGQQLVLPVRN